MFPITLSGKQILFSVVVVAAVSAAATRYLWPAVVIETVEHETVKNNVVTVIKTVKEPSGAEDTITTITDHSVTQQVSDTSIAQVKPNWAVGGGIGTNLHDLVPSYHVEVNRRIIGPLFIGVSGSTDGAVRASVLIEF